MGDEGVDPTHRETDPAQGHARSRHERGEVADPSVDHGPPDEGPGGPFSSWTALYVTLVVYGAVTIAVLLVLTRIMAP